MNLNSRIKNDLWRVNYIIPFAKKYIAEGSTYAKAMAVARVTLGKRVSKGHGGRRSVGCDTLQLMKEVTVQVEPKRPFAYSIDEIHTLAVPGNVLSNFPLDYGEVVNGCLEDLFAKAISLDDEYGRQARYACDALHVLRDKMLRATSEAGDGRWDRSGALERLFDGPAKTFHEGLQRVLFFNQVMWQTRHRLNGLGRLDRTLGHLYESDLATGLIDEKDGEELIDAFLEALHKYYEYKSDALVGDVGQIIILGGLNEDGSYHRNSLTDLFLERQAAVKYPDPKTLLRVSASMPRDLMEKAVRCLSSATGSPLFSNDDRVIPALISDGVDVGDAYEYCVSACWEPLVPGLSLGQNNIAVFDACRVLVDTVRDANDLMAYEDVLRLYEGRLALEFGKFLEGLNGLRWARDPIVSILYPDSIEQRIDVSDGGSKYRDYGVTTIGVSNAVDSLMNIKKLLNKGRVLSQISNAAKKNFKGDEALRATLASGKQFGSDAGNSSSLTKEIVGVLNSVASIYKNPLGGSANFGLSSPDYIKGGTKSPADFSGRLSGDPYVVHISNTSAAYTELVNFAASLEYDGHRLNGNVVDFFVSPSLLEGSADAFVDFMMSAVEAGFYQMQMNVMDSATLIDAKENPERYPGLIVRVWGFSAYFNDLPNSYKDYLIQRALESEAA